MALAREEVEVGRSGPASPSNTIIVQRTQEKFDAFLLGLTFTFLGLSIHTKGLRHRCGVSFDSLAPPGQSPSACARSVRVPRTCFASRLASTGSFPGRSRPG